MGEGWRPGQNQGSIKERDTGCLAGNQENLLCILQARGEAIATVQCGEENCRGLHRAHVSTRTPFQKSDPVFKENFLKKVMQ